MGIAYYCDRCEELFDDAEIPKHEIVISGAFSNELEATLCFNCAKSLEGYIEGDDLKEGDKNE